MLSATATASEDGKLTLPVPDEFKGMEVQVSYYLKTKYRGPVDKRGWPVGFFEEFAGSIRDPKFRRYPPEEDFSKLAGD
jgi:hypothetical protein